MKSPTEVVNAVMHHRSVMYDIPSEEDDRAANLIDESMPLPRTKGGIFQEVGSDIVWGLDYDIIEDAVATRNLSQLREFLEKFEGCDVKFAIRGESGTAVYGALTRRYGAAVTIPEKDAHELLVCAFAVVLAPLRVRPEVDDPQKIIKQHESARLAITGNGFSREAEKFIDDEMLPPPQNLQTGVTFLIGGSLVAISMDEIPLLISRAGPAIMGISSLRDADKVGIYAYDEDDDCLVAACATASGVCIKHVNGGSGSLRVMIDIAVSIMESVHAALSRKIPDGWEEQKWT